MLGDNRWAKEGRKSTGFFYLVNLDKHPTPLTPSHAHTYFSLALPSPPHCVFWTMNLKACLLRWKIDREKNVKGWLHHQFFFFLVSDFFFPRLKKNTCILSKECYETPTSATKLYFYVLQNCDFFSDYICKYGFCMFLCLTLFLDNFFVITNVPVYPFKLYNSVVFSIFTKLNNVINFRTVHHPKKKFCTYLHSLPESSQPPGPGNHSLLLSGMNL